jgi:tetratricopeptide (TPR) repeat protein
MNARFFKHLFVLLILAGIASARAATNELVSAFDNASRLYGQDRFSEAAQAYEDILKNGLASPALYFNLANARFRSGQVGRAIVSYRRAGLLAPRDPDIRANLQFARNHVEGPTLKPGLVERCVSGLSLNEWTVLCAAAFWGFLLLLSAGQWRPQWRPALRRFQWVAGAALVMLACCVVLAWNAGSVRIAVVVEKDAIVRNGPLDEQSSVCTVHDGAELLVLDEKDGWVQVADGGKRSGWIKRSAVVDCSAGI